MGRIARTHVMQQERHDIITRFNVNIYDIDFPNRLKDTWLSLRFELFQKYCFPTLQAQENQNFTWLVLFDEQTPERYRTFINIYSKYRNFIPVYCGSYKTIMPTVIKRMKEIALDVDWYVSTRLDNDDALSVKFVQCVQGVVSSLSKEQLKPSDTLYLNFTNGCRCTTVIFMISRT